ncbi:MAG: bifunctional 4-hydroxy-2-oxoglutarate aldolase/2-dehydro-3-deoxy-phosphogluconate aldolase [Lysinibacillus sp.]
MLLEKIKKDKIVAIFRHVTIEALLKQADLLLENDINILEITLNSEGALEVIYELKRRFSKDICIGAGTVMSEEDVVSAKDAGAAFIISPHMDVDVIKKTKELELLSISGAITPTEIFTAHKNGADMIKIFPASSLGVNYVKSLKGPFPSIPFMATGGIDEHNAKDYINSGYDAIGMGSSLTSAKIESVEEFKRKIKLLKSL